MEVYRNDACCAQLKGCAAVLFGWFGSKSRQLQRHRKLLSDEIGFEKTLVAIPSVLSTANPRIGAQKGRELSEYVERNKIGEKGIVAVAMSGAGENGLAHFVSNMDQKRIKGVIYDSAPVPNTSQNWARAMTAVVSSRIGKVRYDFPVMTQIFTYFNEIRGKMRENCEWTEKSERIVDEMVDRSVPFLFLHSDCDVLAPPEHIETRIQVLKRKGRDVSSVCFNGSPHVDHLRSFPEEYKTTVKQFVEGLF